MPPNNPIGPSAVHATGAMPSGARRQSRGPAALYSALAFGLVVLVASLAFTARQPPPPQIAELTPQAQHQITKAPNQFTSNLGSGVGGPGGGGAPTTTTTTVPSTGPGGQSNPAGAIDVPAVHHCFGNPPRQIEDTQSPPCVSYWSGNNGGATAQGVSATEIKVLAINPPDQRTLSDLQAFFNRYFEFYGRQLDLIPAGDGVSSSGNSDCAAAQAGADGTVQQYRPFAATDQSTTAIACFEDQMARDHVIMSNVFPYFSDANMTSLAPYLYQYPMGLDGEFNAMGTFACRQLAGQDASFSTDPLLSHKKRTFGLIVQYDASDLPPDPSPLSQALARCGQKLVYSTEIEEQNPNRGSSIGGDQGAANYETQSANAVDHMAADGVTTVFCMCVEPAAIPAAADSQHYYPEWLLTGTMDNWDWVVQAYWPDSDQRTALMGIQWEPPQVPLADTTFQWAINAVDPGYNDEQEYGDLRLSGDQEFYWQALLIAAGIQMAGPDLTPYSFQRGLQQAEFPNPYSAEMEGAAGFGGATHSMTKDATLTYWSNSAPSPYQDTGSGAWCYVDGGRRFTAANWPSGPPDMFNPQQPCYTTPVTPFP